MAFLKLNSEENCECNIIIVGCPRHLLLKVAPHAKTYPLESTELVAAQYSIHHHHILYISLYIQGFQQYMQYC